MAELSNSEIWTTTRGTTSDSPKLRTLERVVLQVECQLVPNPGEVLLDFSRAGEGLLHVGQNIFRADALEKFRSREKLRRLIARATHEEYFARFVQTLREAFECVDSGGIERRHITEAQDDNVAKMTEVARSFGQLLGGSEEEWPVDAEDRHIGGDVLILQDVGLPVAEVVTRDR